jgi:hypothetical protein
MRVLPAVFALAEACIEALATDTARAEAAGGSDEDADVDMLPVFSDRWAPIYVCIPVSHVTTSM